MTLPWFRLFAFLATAVALSAQAVRFEPARLESADGATAPALASAYDGSLYAAWVEPDGNGHRLQLAQFDRETDTWSAPRQVATGNNWFINDADTPVLAAGLRGKVIAVWYVQGHGEGHAYHAVYATSEDHGMTWTTPAPLTTESDRTEFVSIAPLINGHWLAVWLDGRGHATDGNMQLRSRTLGNVESDTLVDDRVCDCCNLATLVLPNGAVMLAYRDRSADEVRDIAIKRFRRKQWEDAPAPPADGWQINACPVNGPQLSRRGAHVALSWFTAADDRPRAMTARSNNIGQSWNLAGTVSPPDTTPRGQTDVAVTRDGSQWISWVDADGALALRRVDRDKGMHLVQRLPIDANESLGPYARPRMTLLDNRSDQPARLMIVRPEPCGIRSYVANLPLEEGAAVDACGCGPGETETKGHALRGTITDVQPETNTLIVAHEGIPDVMPAQTFTFHVDPAVIPLVETGKRVMARTERRDDGKWWLFSIRLLQTVE